MQTDNELLGLYIDGSEEAFQQLVQRRINLVYSAALRECHGNSADAEEITQQVFTELARRGRSLVGHPAISGWLYSYVRNSSANLRRSKARRQRRETEVSMSTEQEATMSATLWDQIRPEIDDAMHQLSEEDRIAVLLRFFEGRTLKEVGDALRINDNAARMRVERALERLRAFLARRGISSTGSALAAALAAGAIGAAPSALAATVGQLACTIRPLDLAPVSAPVISGGFKAVLAIAAGVLMVAALWQFNSKVFLKRSAADSAAAAQSITSPSVPSEKTAAASAAPQAVYKNQMELHVLDAESGEPLAARLHLFYGFKDGRGKIVKAATDRNGTVAVLRIEPPFEFLNMFVTAEGHVPKVTTWSTTRVMQEQSTMKLERGIPVSGRVVNETGEPVIGAEIEFDGNLRNHIGPDHIQFGPDTKLLTDARGGWTSTMVPRDLPKFTIIARHPDYAEAKAIVVPQFASAETLITMTVGATVSGVLRDATGRGIQGRVGEARLFEDKVKTVECDAEGNYTMRNLKPGKTSLVFQADGFGPRVKALTLTDSLTHLDVILEQGHQLRGRVLDQNGEPLRDAFVETTRGRTAIEWNTKTDAQGRFSWDSAPAEPLVYSVYLEGFKHAWGVELPADGTEREIRLTPDQPEDRIELSGTVTDENGSAVNDFTVLLGESTATWDFPCEFITSGHAGHFDFSIPAEARNPKYRLQILQDGYLPATSRTFARSEGAQAMQFVLRRATNITGIALLPDGHAAANGEIFLCTSEGGVNLVAPDRVDTGLDTTAYRTRTQADGSFSLPPANNPKGIVVLHPNGYAEVAATDPAMLKKIQLEPWGKIEGRLVLASKPIANERIVLSRGTHYDGGERFWPPSVYLEAMTDSEGNFVFPKVPSGQYRVFRQTFLGHGGFESHDTDASVAPGETTHVTLGGSGRTVRGQLAFAQLGSAIDWQTVSVRLTCQNGEPLPERPRREQFASAESFAAASKHFFAIVRSQARYGALCAGDGSFEIADVPAGNYKLEAQLYDRGPSLKGEELNPPPIASVTRQISLGEANDRFDLGVIPLGAR